jgi:hypothetical protein
MTKTELQSALAEATQTDKRTAGIFLDTLGTLAYKEIKKERRICFTRFWQAGEAEEESAHGFQSKDATEDQDSSQDRRQISCCQGRKGRGFGGKEVVKELRLAFGTELLHRNPRSVLQFQKYG